MARALPESRRAPLVLFRLVPLASRSSRRWHSAILRGRRGPPAAMAILPAISDCEQCRGKLLDNGEQCPECGNPLWLFDWLTSLD